MTITRGVPAFVLLSFGIAWTGMVGAWALGFSLVNPLVQLPFGFAPAVAAIVVRRWVTREGFADAGLRPRFRQAWPHYLAAWLGPLALVGATLAAAAAVGLWRPVAPTAPQWGFIGALMLVVPLLTPGYWGEEFGWTSYLRLRLFPGRPLAATLGTGLVWAVWHYPLAFVGYVEFPDVVVGLAVWTASFLCQEVILSWLRLRSGTVWTASLAHAGNNMVLSLLTGFALAGSADATAVTALMAVPLAVVAGWLVLSGRVGDVLESSDVETPRRTVVSYVNRGGRMTVGQTRAWERLWPSLGRDVRSLPPGPLDTDEWFGRSAPLTLEIGPGMGETTAALAEAEPEVNYLAVDVYQPGLAQLMMRAEAGGLKNVRLLRGDAVVLLEDHLPEGSLSTVRIFYPDPWPKKKHHKRRLVQPSLVSVVASRLAPGGTLHLATDWENYAEHMLAVCSAEPLLRNRHDGWAPRPPWRPLTKFESRAEEEGRVSRDLIFERI